MKNVTLIKPCFYGVFRLLLLFITTQTAISQINGESCRNIKTLYQTVARNGGVSILKYDEQTNSFKNFAVLDNSVSGNATASAYSPDSKFLYIKSGKLSIDVYDITVAVSVDLPSNIQHFGKKGTITINGLNSGTGSYEINNDMFVLDNKHIAFRTTNDLGGDLIKVNVVDGLNFSGPGIANYTVKADKITITSNDGLAYICSDYVAFGGKIYGILNTADLIKDYNKCILIVIDPGKGGVNLTKIRLNLQNTLGASSAPPQDGQWGAVWVTKNGAFLAYNNQTGYIYRTGLDSKYLSNYPFFTKFLISVDKFSSNDGFGCQFTPVFGDNDHDGYTDYEDLDDDNDGILDTVESHGVDPWADENGDDYPNLQDITGFHLLDGTHIGFVDNKGDGINDYFDTDNDGKIEDEVPSLYQLAKEDADGDNIPNYRDRDYVAPNGAVFTDKPDGVNDYFDTDGDGIIDSFDPDSDDDGCTDASEALLGDSDGDGFLGKSIVETYLDTTVIPNVMKTSVYVEVDLLGKVINQLNNGYLTLRTDAAYTNVITKGHPSTISVHPKNKEIAAVVGATATFSVTLDTTNPGSGTPLYQWEESSSNNGTTWTEWSDMSGETAASLTISSITCDMSGKKRYRVKVTQSDYVCGVISNAATFTITPPNPPTTKPFTYCSSENKTIADLTSDAIDKSVGSNTINGATIKWYDSSTEGKPYAATDTITSRTYYASQTVIGCESARVPAEITVVGAPFAGEDGPIYRCIADTTPTDDELFAQLTANTRAIDSTKTPTPGGKWSDDENGNYTYTVAPTSPCTISDTAIVNVVVRPTPDAGEDGLLTICEGTTPTDAELSAQLGGTPQAWGTWSHSEDGLLYTYTVKAAPPCTDEDFATVKVTKQRAPNAGTNGNLKICPGEIPTVEQLFASLGGTPDAGGEWSISVEDSKKHIYTVKGSTPCPDATASVDVDDTDDIAPVITCSQDVTVKTYILSQTPTVILVPPIASDNCRLASVTNDHPSTIFPVGTTPVLWTAIDGSGNSATCIQNVIVEFVEVPRIALIKTGKFNDENKDGYAQEGETISYKFKVVNTGNVPLHDVTVTDPLPRIEMRGGSISLEIGESNEDFFTATYTLNKDDIIREFVTNQATAFGTSPKGIRASDNSDDVNEFGDNPTVVPDLIAPVKVYNALTPDNNGINDFFLVEGLEYYPNNNVKIYNRWGVLVYERNNYQNDEYSFEGVSHGRLTMDMTVEKLPAGTYFYLINYTNVKSQTHKKSGFIDLRWN